MRISLNQKTKLLNLLGEEPASLPITINDSITSESELDIPYNPTLPIDFAVSQKLKTKIISHQYVSFNQLLSPDNTEKFTLQFTKTQQGPSLSFAPTKTKEFITYQQWTKAFEIFVSIYLMAHPKSGPGLMKYGADIRELFTAYGGTAWKIYDETFRKWRASTPTARSWPWGRTHTEMWLKATTLGARTTHPGRQNLAYRYNNATNQPFQDSPLCKNFAFRGGCSFGEHCKYKHECPICSCAHSKSKCPKNKPSATSSSLKTSLNKPDKIHNKKQQQSAKRPNPN